MDARDERIAKNEVVFRATNREIEQAVKEAAGDSEGVLEVLCECGQEGCSGLISLTVAEYDGTHVQDDRFIVLPGHENPQIESVVERRAEYLVVDKFGEAEEIAEESE
jgi:hypothetical protein